MVVPGARRLRAGDNNPPGSRSGCRGGLHGHPPTPPPARPGAAPVRAWWGRGLGVPRPHAGYSPTASLLAPRAPPPPTAPASCSDPGHPGPCVASATALGWGLLFPHRPRRVPCSGTLGDGLRPHRDELSPWHWHGARLAPGSRSGCRTWCSTRAGTGCAQSAGSSLRAAEEHWAARNPPRHQQIPPLHQRDNRTGVNDTFIASTPDQVLLAMSRQRAGLGYARHPPL